MTHKTQPTAHAEITAPISADLRRIPGLSEQDAGLLEQAASMLEGLHNDERNRGNCSAAEGAACSADAVRRLAVQMLRDAPAATTQQDDDWLGQQIDALGYAQKDAPVAVPGALTFAQWWDRERAAANSRLPGDDWMDLDPEDRDQYEAAFNAGARTSPAAVTVPEGWALVPINPTFPMMAASMGHSSRREMFRAMIAAAPAAPAQRQYIGHVQSVADLVNNLLLLDQTLPIYGAQYVEHPAGKRRAITVPPTVSREQVKDARWIGEGDTLNAAVIWTRAEQPARQDAARLHAAAANAYALLSSGVAIPDAQYCVVAELAAALVAQQAGGA